VAFLALASLAGPILFTEIYARAISDWRAWAPVGAPFFVASAFMLLALSLALSRREATTRQPGAS
jgi:hypothetical protein